MIKMIWEDARNTQLGIQKEGVFRCQFQRKYRYSEGLWFRIIRSEAAPQLFIDNKKAYAAFKSGFDLESSSSTCCLTPTSSLDSDIEEDSHLFKMLSELKNIDRELTKAIASLKASDVRPFFEANTINFSPYSHINFDEGLPFVGQGIQSLSKDQLLDIAKFDSIMGAAEDNYPAHNDLLERERDTRLDMIHSLGTVHLMEMFVDKVSLVHESYRGPLRLSPSEGKGIAKRMLTNVKNDTISWMAAKMEVRRSLLPNWKNQDALTLLMSTLWCPDIFPEKAIEKLKAKYPRVSNLKALLRNSGGRPDPTDQVLYQHHD